MSTLFGLSSDLSLACALIAALRITVHAVISVSSLNLPPALGTASHGENHS